MFKHNLFLERNQYATFSRANDVQNDNVRNFSDDSDVNVDDDFPNSATEKLMNSKKSESKKSTEKKKLAKSTKNVVSASSSTKKIGKNLKSSSKAKSSSKSKLIVVQPKTKLKSSVVKKTLPNKDRRKTYSKRALSRFEKEFMPIHTTAGKERYRKLQRNKNHESQ